MIFLDIEEYEALLIIAGLALYTRYGFKMKPTAWSEFINGHQFATNNSPIEFVHKKIDLDEYINEVPPSQNNQISFYVISIGNKLNIQPTKLRTRQVGMDIYLQPR